MNPTSVLSRLLAVGALALAAGCAPMPAAPPQTIVTATPPPERHVAGVPVAALPASAAGAASAPAADEAPRLIRGTDRVVGAAPASAPPRGAPIDLRFEDAPIREVVHAILGDLLKLDYVIYPPLDGRVTISTSSQIAPDLAVFLLEAALQANGLAMARDARGVYHLGKAEALKAVVPVVRQVTKEPLPPGYGAIVVPLRYIGAAEMAGILRPLAPADAIVRVDTVRNLLVLAGNRAQAEGWLSMVATFDIDLLAGMSVGVFPLKYASVRDVEAALQMMSPGASRGGAAPAAGGAAAAGAAQAAAAAGLGENHPLFGAMRILPMERLNSIVVVTPRAAYLDEARRWIERLDRPGNSAAEARLHVYAVRNGSARHLGEVLNGIFGGTAQGPASGAASGVAPGLAAVTGRTPAAPGPAAAVSGVGSGSLSQTLSTLRGTGLSVIGGQGVSTVQLQGNVRVVADEINNSILVYSSAAQFERIEEALRRLDMPPTQVLIEASIIEVSLTDAMNYGVQWLFTDSHGDNSGTGVLSNLPGGVLGGPLAGFSYTLRNSLGNVRLVLNALAEKSLLKVISTPSLMVLDNHTASIVVGNQQPIQSTETVTDGGTRTVGIQYKDTGVSLSVTPSVGSGDMVTMSINQAVTDVGPIDVATGQRSFLQRQIGSKVAVRSGETLVLGGLIRDNDTSGSSGLPGLHEVPVLGALFGTKTQDTNRTELLVVITPRVARTDEDAREISRALRDRMQGLSVLQGGGAAAAPAVVPDPALQGGPNGLPSSSTIP
jgi:general secretion pathway protein D